MPHDENQTSTPDGRDRLIRAARAELSATGVSGLSLRAIARRAGVSHAAPKYHFGDRAGLLTAVAAAGYTELAKALEGTAVDGPPSIASLGRAYVDFGLDNLELFDLMFRPSELHPDDPELGAAQSATLVLLDQAVRGGKGNHKGGEASAMTLVSWTFAHGLVELLRSGALQALVGDDAEPIRDHLVTLFDSTMTAAEHH